jgi:hypothetical protein
MKNANTERNMDKKRRRNGKINRLQQENLILPKNLKSIKPKKKSKNSLKILEKYENKFNNLL